MRQRRAPAGYGRSPARGWQGGVQEGVGGGGIAAVIPSTMGAGREDREEEGIGDHGERKCGKPKLEVTVG